MPISYLYLQRFLTTAFIALTFSLALSAQKKEDKKPDGPPPDVSVNLLVVGAGGKSVSDVKVSDVMIFEDGVEQKIDELKPRGPLKYLTILFDAILSKARVINFNLHWAIFHVGSENT